MKGIAVLILLVLIKNIDCGCQDWKAFKDEKCFKIISDQLKDYKSSIDVCKENQNSSLLVIKTAEEQKFLNKFIFELINLKVLDNVWIGLMKDKTTGKFQWNDGNSWTYTNWAIGYPINKTGYDCVQMMPETGAWTNADCKKRDAVVCQRIPDFTLKELQQGIMEIKEHLKILQKEINETKENEKVFQRGMSEVKENVKNKNTELKKELNKTNTELDLLKNNQNNFSNIPIGFIYVQLSNQPDPQLLFPNTEWSNISNEYAGLFFRTLGGRSAPFGQIQDDASPRITRVNCSEIDMVSHHSSTRMFDVNSDGTSRWTEGEVYSTYGLYTGSQTGNSRFTRFQLSISEVRPKNTAVKIWKRVK